MLMDDDGKSPKDGKREKNRRAGASNGQRYPLPCCTHFFSILRLKQGSGPEGSYGTQGGISVRPWGAGAL